MLAFGKVTTNALYAQKLFNHIIYYILIIAIYTVSNEKNTMECAAAEKIM